MGAIMKIVDENGVQGLLFRGLGLKIISNGISSIMFTVMWRYLMERWSGAGKDKGKGKDGNTCKDEKENAKKSK
jgi:hypothetical protein